MISKVVGISFYPTDNPKISKKSPVTIIHDKENKFSSRAIAVMFGDQLLGHIGEKNNEYHEEVFDQLPLKGEVSRLARLQEGEKFAKFTTGQITSLEVEFDMPSDNKNGTISFNEPDVNIVFEPIEHSYHYGDKKLMGGSTYIKRWIKEFDAEAIAPRYAESLGLKGSQIIQHWAKGGTVAADFGTAIHQALEHYYKNKEIGQLIMEQKDKPFNTALPTHPVLRQIVEDFISKFGSDGCIESEVLVSNVEMGLCGQIDRLDIIDREKKICRVQDYKINVEAEVINPRNKFLGQMAPLPANKLSKYRMQMSFYARLLELSGWTVEGLTAFVYDGEWKAYEMDMLNLDF